MTTGQMLVPIAVILACAGYLLPFLIADHKKHPRLPAVFGLNLLLGWTLIGWIAALLWALAPSKLSNDQQAEVSR